MARNSIILNGKSSNTITGLIIQELPPISKPLMRSQVEEIDGRDGDIITKLGFSAYDKEISVGLYGNFDINEIIAYFNSEGTVTFSNEPDKFYYYQILEQIDFERLVRFRTATINFHVQPFKYSTTEEAETIEAETVSGEGNNIVLENTSDAPFSKLTPKGDTYQLTYTGKNKMPMPIASMIESNERQRNFRIDLPIDTYTVSFDLDSFELGTNTSFNIYMQLRYSDDTQYDMAIISIDSSTTLGRKSFAFTTTKVASSSTSLGTSNIRITATNWNNGARALITNIQIESGSPATAYEPYVGGIPSPNPDYPQDIQVVTGEQTVKVVGMNLLPPPADFNDTLGTLNISCSKGVWTFSGTSQSGYTQSSKSVIAPYTIQAGDYFHYNNTLVSQRINIALTFTDNTTFAASMNAANRIVSLENYVGKTISTVRANFNTGYEFNGTAKPMILHNVSTVTAYEPYQAQSYPISLGSTELCKIGTYQDYIWKDGSDWKIHKAIGKVVATGSLDANINWYAQPTSSLGRFYSTIINDSFYSENQSEVFMTHFHYTTTSELGACYLYKQRFYVFYGTATTTATEFKTWLSTNNTTVYYPLATPTDTAITDETLLGQLDDLAAAHAYKGRTHIISTAGSDANLPHIIEAKVLGSSDTTITNAGNFISKPKFTIYGSGNIGLYINGIQILQIALGDEQYITIDAAQMEAYKDTLDNLKNRLVTGDYTNLALNPGENQISFSGSVEKYIVENYSRWL